MEKNIDKTSEEILRIYNGLPKIIQDAITKSGWEKKVRDIVTKNKLRVDQGTQLENMVFALMMGQFSAEELYTSIMEDFDLDEGNAKLLFQDIDEQIFGNIEGIIMRLELNEQEKDLLGNKKEVAQVKSIEKKEPSEKTWEEKTLSSDSILRRDTNTFLREGVDTATANDEILTVTRDEILRGIEEPEEADEDVEPFESDVPNTVTTSTPDVPVSTQPIPSTDISSDSKTDTNFMSDTSDTETMLDPVDDNLPNLTNSNVMPGLKKEKSKTIDPVEAGFGSKVSTSSKDYKSTDPYRESIN